MYFPILNEKLLSTPQGRIRGLLKSQSSTLVQLGRDLAPQMVVKNFRESGKVGEILFHLAR